MKYMDIKPKSNNRIDIFNSWLNDMTSKFVTASYSGAKKIEITEPKIKVRDESKTVHLTSCRQYAGGVFTKDYKKMPKITTVLTVPYWHLDEEV